MKLIVILLALTGLGWAAAEWLPGMLDPAEAAETVAADGLFTVRRGELTVTLVENGTLVAKESRSVDKQTRSSSKITFLAEEGAFVQENEVVARLDATQQEEQLEQREMEILQAQADLDTAQTNLEIQVTDNQASIEKAGNEVERSTQELKRYVEGEAPKERRELLVAISEAETNHTRAKKKHEDSQRLLAQEFITALEAEEDEIAWKRAEVQLESARKNLDMFEVYTLPMSTKEKEVAVADADRELENSGKRATSNLRQREVAVEQHRARLDKLGKQKEELIDEINKMELVAPSPGIVIYGDPREPWERENIRVGSEIWGRTTIITLPDLRVMEVKLRIHEADISKVVVGQQAKVTMDTYPGLVLDGTVTRIASIATGDNRWDDDPEVKKFDVEITLQSEGVDVELKPGVSAKAEVFIESKPDVLYVPIQCVVLEEGRHLAYVVGADGKPQATLVTPGLSNQNWVEIREGLSEGLQVLLYNPNLSGSTETGSEDELLPPGATETPVAAVASDAPAAPAEAPAVATEATEASVAPVAPAEIAPSAAPTGDAGGAPGALVPAVSASG